MPGLANFSSYTYTVIAAQLDRQQRRLAAVRSAGDAYAGHPGGAERVLLGERLG